MRRRALRRGVTLHRAETPFHRVQNVVVGATNAAVIVVGRSILVGETRRNLVVTKLKGVEIVESKIIKFYVLFAY